MAMVRYFEGGETLMKRHHSLLAGRSCGLPKEHNKKRGTGSRTCLIHSQGMRENYFLLATLESHGTFGIGQGEDK